MYMAPDDAKTDVILAAAAVILGPSLRAFAGGSSASGVLGVVVELLWLVAITTLIPVLLARYRNDHMAAFGWRGLGGAFGPGILLAVPAVAVGFVTVTTAGLPLAGRLGVGDPVGLLLQVLVISVLSIGSFVLVAFLAVRAREGFPRSPDVPLHQLVRTAGLVLVVAAGIGGVLRGLTGGSLLISLSSAVAVAIIVFLVERMLPTDAPAVPRAAIIAPLVVITIANLYARGGFIFGDLPGGLTAAAVGGGTALAISVFALTRRGSGVTIPLVIAVHLWPTCLSPVPLAGGIC
ncbi:MAG: hypothetical protein JJT89_16220 [Nitriliruptoraceae bacterium]|nr:hypothetical protein [Nitriliruptoraceae bacterium]